MPDLTKILFIALLTKISFGLVKLGGLWRCSYQVRCNLESDSKPGRAGCDSRLKLNVIIRSVINRIERMQRRRVVFNVARDSQVTWRLVQHNRSELRRLRGNYAVNQMDYPIGLRSELIIVGDHHDGKIFMFPECCECFHNLGTIF